MTQTKTQEMAKIVVRRDNKRDLRFAGTQIASTYTSPERSRSNYSGSTGRWCELYLYLTRSGKFVCSEIGGTQWQGEHTRYSGAVCETHAEVIEFFGDGWLAKELYREAGIEAAEEVD